MSQRPKAMIEYYSYTEILELSQLPKKSKSWGELLSDDLLFLAPAMFILSGLAITVLHSGAVGDKFSYSLVVTAIGGASIGLVTYMCKRLNDFRENDDR